MSADAPRPSAAGAVGTPALPTVTPTRSWALSGCRIAGSVTGAYETEKPSPPVPPPTHRSSSAVHEARGVFGRSTAHLRMRVRVRVRARVSVGTRVRVRVRVRG